MHDKIIIEGKNKLSGEISVKGAKNAALKVMAAALLSVQPTTITNLPDIEDVKRMRELLESIGVKVTVSKNHIIIDPQTLKTTDLKPVLAGKLRASVILAGPLLARLHEVFIPYPGGCNLGQRPIDIFLDGFKALGAKIQENETGYKITTVGKLQGTKILLPRVSVTVTETLMMAATLATGTTVIKNSAMEPEIPALAEYLNQHGAKITGAGTTTIIIEGVNKLKAGTISLIPDRIEAGTFAILGILTNSEITITNSRPEHLESLWLHLQKAGAKIEIDGHKITTKPHGPLKTTNLITHEYPGFVTDIQAPYTVLMTQAEGSSLIHETIFPGRLFYTDLLRSMGANIIMCDPHRVVVNGPTNLFGRYLSSPDIRAGIALILAGLIAEGKTTIDNIYQIDRGYENIVERLANLGANIKRTSINT